MVHLFSLLSNFELPQLVSAPGVEATTVQTGSTRADLQRQADELQAELVTRYAAGATVKALAAEHGMHHQTVRASLVTAGALIRTRQRLTQAELDEMARLYKSGLTTTEIGKQFDMYASSVGRYLKKVGIELRAPKRRPAIQQFKPGGRRHGP